MIQEVVRLDTELQLHRFLNLEILEESQIGIEEGGAIDRGQNGRTVLEGLSRHGEAARVDPLVVSQIRGRIASDDRIQLNGIGPQDGLVRDLFRCSGNRNSIQSDIEIPAGAYTSQIRSALEL